jgi:sporulation protein YlmC with PRC-barrel domain
MTCHIRWSELKHTLKLASMFATAFVVTSLLYAQVEIQVQEGAKPQAPAASGASHWLQARNLLFTKVVGQDGKQLGEVADVAFLPYGGVLDSAVIKLTTSDGKVKVPFTSLQWKAKDRQYSTSMTREQLAAMPAFDAKDHGGGQEGMEAKKDKDKGKEIDIAGTGQKEGQGVADASVKPSQHLLLSKLEQHPVMAGTETIGRIGQVFLEANPRSVVLVTVKTGTDLGQGDTYLIPWRALRFDATGKLMTSVDSAKLETAPKLERLESLDDPEYLRKVTAFYGVPAIELQKSDGTGTR